MACFINDINKIFLIPSEINHKCDACLVKYNLEALKEAVSRVAFCGGFRGEVVIDSTNPLSEQGIIKIFIISTQSAGLGNGARGIGEIKIPHCLEMDNNWSARSDYDIHRKHPNPSVKVENGCFSESLSSGNYDVIRDLLPPSDSPRLYSVLFFVLKIWRAVINFFSVTLMSQRKDPEEEDFVSQVHSIPYERQCS